MKTQLPKILEAIATTGGEYFQPVANTPRGPVTIPWRHNARFGDKVLTFDKRFRKEGWVSFYTQGGKRFNFRHTSPVSIVVRGIKRYLTLC